MIIPKSIFFIGLLSVLSACQQSASSSAIPATTDAITQAISGKRLVVDRGDFLDVGADGTVVGMTGPNQTDALAGTWEARNGQFCRTLTSPAAFAGTACQDVTLNGDGTITIDGTNGPLVWTIQ